MAVDTSICLAANDCPRKEVFVVSHFAALSQFYDFCDCETCAAFDQQAVLIKLLPEMRVLPSLCVSSSAILPVTILACLVTRASVVQYRTTQRAGVHVQGEILTNCVRHTWQPSLTPQRVHQLHLQLELLHLR